MTSELKVSYPSSWEEWESRVQKSVELLPSCLDASNGPKYKIVMDYIPMNDRVSQTRYKHMMYQIFISDPPRDRERIITFSNQISLNFTEKKYNQQISSAITGHRNKNKINIKKYVPKKRSKLEIRMKNEKARKKKKELYEKSNDDNTLLQPPLLPTPEDFIPDSIKSNNNSNDNITITLSHSIPDVIVIDADEEFVYDSNPKDNKKYSSYIATAIEVNNPDMDGIRILYNKPLSIRYEKVDKRAYKPNLKERKKYRNEANEKIKQRDIALASGEANEPLGVHTMFSDKEIDAVITPEMREKCNYDLGIFASLLRGAERRGDGVAYRRIWTYIYGWKCTDAQFIECNKKAIGLQHGNYRGCGKCNNCWNRFATVIISCFGFQQCNDSIALPHFYYIFNQHPKYSQFSWDDWCKINESDLYYILGPTSMQSLKACSSRAMLQDISKQRKENNLTMVPMNINFYCWYSYCSKKSAILMNIGSFGYWVDIGIANDVWVGRGVICNDWLIAFINALGPIDTDDSSADVCRIVERLFSTNNSLRSCVNDIFGSVGMIEPKMGQTDFLLEEAKSYGSNSNIYINKLSSFRKEAEKAKTIKAMKKNSKDDDDNEDDGVNDSDSDYTDMEH